MKKTGGRRDIKSLFYNYMIGFESRTEMEQNLRFSTRKSPLRIKENETFLKRRRREGRKKTLKKVLVSSEKDGQRKEEMEWLYSFDTK